MAWDPKEKIAHFVEELREGLGEDLESVTRYGSIPRGEGREGVSDVNLLVLLRDAGPVTLARGAPAAQRWREETGAVPLLFTPREWRRSADVFPVEVADMKEHSRVLLGSDPVRDLSTSHGHLRLQVERELRGKLAQLRRGLFLAADHPPDVGRLLLGEAPSVATYLRALLRLHRQPVPAATPEVVRAAAALSGGPAEPFLDVWGGRDRPAAFEPTTACTEGVLELLLRTADHVDSMEAR
jgi:hypothetical protein